MSESKTAGRAEADSLAATDLGRSDDAARVRRLVYALLLTVVAGAGLGRIFAAERVNEPSLHKPDRSDPRPLSVWPKELPPASPLFGSNDRSRWATIRALVDHGTYAIGEREYDPDGQPLRSPQGKPLDRSTWRQSGWDSDWDTVDKVLDPVTHKFYSSKPPLLATVLAGLYWLLELVTGWSLGTNLFEVVRTMLVLVNLMPFLVYLALLGRLVERFGQTDWARLYVMVAACFATLVTPFLVTLNNHNVATYCVLYATYAALMVWQRGAPWYFFAAAGLLSSFAATCELPAAAFAAGLGLVLLLRDPRRTLLIFVPAALLPLAGFFLTNWLAIGQWQPAYAKFGTEWYTYEGSHWEKAKRGIDFAAGTESRAVYALNVLVGHHGLFSLTPMWLLAFAGMVAGILQLRRRTPPALGHGLPALGHGLPTVPAGVSSALGHGLPTVPAEYAVADAAGSYSVADAAGSDSRPPWWFYPAALLLSLVIVGFYLLRPAGERNYGGWTSGLRWLMWLTPIWLLCMLPVLDRLAQRRWSRGLGYVLLALSVLSVSYPAWNPWRHPWIYRFMDAHGWIPY